MNKEHPSNQSAGVADDGVTVTDKFGNTAILDEILADTHDEFYPSGYRQLL